MCDLRLFFEGLDHPGERPGKVADLIPAGLFGYLDGQVTGGDLLCSPHEIDQGPGGAAGKEEEKDESEDEEDRADGKDHVAGKTCGSV